MGNPGKFFPISATGWLTNEDRATNLKRWIDYLKAQPDTTPL
jgi:hypothetical protein